MPFRYQAIDAHGKTVTDVIDAPSLREAGDLLRERQLFVTRLAETGEAASENPAAATAADAGFGGRLKEIVFLTQQLSMLIRSGARVVPALSVIESQCPRPALRNVVTAIRTEVEAGRPFSVALSRFPKLFTPVYVNVVAAGEASGNIGLAFERLTKLMRQQLEIRNRVIGALTYPLVLLVLCSTVVTVLFTFVLPRFSEMYETVGVALPISTRLMIATANWSTGHWTWLLGALATILAGGYVFLHSQVGKRVFSRLSVRVPVFGRIVRSVIFAQVCRVWGQLLDSRVGLLEAVQLTQEGTGNLDFNELLARMGTSITDGQSISGPLLSSWLVPRTFAAAIVTGEESGRLADALLFVAGCLEEDNAQTLSSLSRIIEPIMLMVMGLIVGTVAISLFTPLFDLATIAGSH